MRPETEKRPTARFRAAAPPAWARGPAADGRAAETARAVSPLGLLLACFGRRPRPDRRIESDGWETPSAEQKRGRPSDLASCRSTAGSGRQQRGPDEAQEAQARGSGRAKTGRGPFSISGRMNSSRICFFFYFRSILNMNLNEFA